MLSWNEARLRGTDGPATGRTSRNTDTVGRESVPMGAMDYQWTWQVGRRCEVELARIGGIELVTDAGAEARWYADLYHPWTGRGPEPPARIQAWLAVIYVRLAFSQSCQRLETLPT